MVTFCTSVLHVAIYVYENDLYLEMNDTIAEKNFYQNSGTVKTDESVWKLVDVPIEIFQAYCHRNTQFFLYLSTSSLRQTD